MKPPIERINPYFYLSMITMFYFYIWNELKFWPGLISLPQSNYAGPIDDLDPDSNVLKLNKDLSSMEEMLAQSLQPKKFKSEWTLCQILFVNNRNINNLYRDATFQEILGIPEINWQKLSHDSQKK